MHAQHAHNSECDILLPNPRITLMFVHYHFMNAFDMLPLCFCSMLHF